MTYPGPRNPEENFPERAIARIEECKDKEANNNETSDENISPRELLLLVVAALRVLKREDGSTMNEIRRILVGGGFITPSLNIRPALADTFLRVRQDKVKDVVIQHDNARPHTSRQTQCALQQLELPTIPHPTYSPDLAPSDFFLFPLLKKHLKGNHYETDAEVEADVLSWCRSQTPEFFADGMRKLVQRWRLCIERDGDYVEK
ncbi:hypothetical protein EGW08_014897 [Elysia chlorotica]|uniref:Tc1-like transposase DDE domain-containing protein n=1 Tax=Elysia chlorotica TaxID=188477 RepID=A0A433T719_ELYCH|nr:hypothetical protein EGW08_014897 [Elysia chlorotica]